eukprot:GHVS01062710.1.p2 GENE.GHVS01062710.1~~GHVS01062710.1.p2  ORF type:complete len:128 (-),score=12.99 GHVS01062710.1:299-682(-)
MHTRENICNTVCLLAAFVSFVSGVVVGHRSARKYILVLRSFITVALSMVAVLFRGFQIQQDARSEGVVDYDTLNARWLADSWFRVLFVAVVSSGCFMYGPLGALMLSDYREQRRATTNGKSSNEGSH